MKSSRIPTWSNKGLCFMGLYALFSPLSEGSACDWQLAERFKLNNTPFAYRESRDFNPPGISGFTSYEGLGGNNCSIHQSIKIDIDFPQKSSFVRDKLGIYFFVLESSSKQLQLPAYAVKLNYSRKDKTYFMQFDITKVKDYWVKFRIASVYPDSSLTHSSQPYILRYTKGKFNLESVKHR